MKHATPSTGNGPLTGIFSGPQSFATQQVPDACELGYELVNGTWQKSAATLAAEASESDLATKRASLTNSIATLRSWADDAEDAVSNPAKWDVWTTTQRFAALKTTLTRLGVFFDGFADLIETRR